ncbi:MAG: hypothetical protein H8E40_05655 [Chloroflexi bacterium]|nr:hypothetical protein [Chloroflexota bacterium]
MFNIFKKGRKVLIHSKNVDFLLYAIISTSSQEVYEMVMPIAQFPFEGPLSNIKEVKSESGVYAVMCEFVDKFYLLDVGLSDDIRSEIANHERKKCWERFKKGKIRYAVLYTNVFPNLSDSQIVKNIRSTYKNIPCGAEIELDVKM